MLFLIVTTGWISSGMCRSGSKSRSRKGSVSRRLRIFPRQSGSSSKGVSSKTRSCSGKHCCSGNYTRR